MLLHGRAERAPAWPGRPPGSTRLSAARSHRPGPGGAQRCSQAAVPEPMVRAERRGLPASPGGSHSTLPAPSLRRGCLGDTRVKRRRPCGQTSPSDAGAGQGFRPRSSPEFATTSGCPQLQQARLQPSPLHGFGEGDTSSSPAKVRTKRPRARAGCGRRAPTRQHPWVRGNPWPPSPRPLPAPGQVTSTLLTPPAPSRALPACTSVSPGSSPCSTSSDFTELLIQKLPAPAPPRPLPQGHFSLLIFN